MSNMLVDEMPSPQVACQEPSLSDVDLSHSKQQSKRKLFTPLNIMILLGALAIIGAGTYYLLNVPSEKDMKNQITESHDKIITYADSSKKEGSSSGSSSSKPSSTSNKPNPKSHPASKTIISSNRGITGAGSPGDDEDEPNEDDNSEKKKKSTAGSSTEIDSDNDSQEEENQEEDANEPKHWIDTKLPGNNSPPMVGNARDGGR